MGRFFILAGSFGRSFAEEVKGTNGADFLLSPDGESVVKPLQTVAEIGCIGQWIQAIQACPRMLPVAKKVFIVCNDDHMPQYHAWAATFKTPEGTFPVENIISNGAILPMLRAPVGSGTCEATFAPVRRDMHAAFLFSLRGRVPLRQTAAADTSQMATTFRRCILSFETLADCTPQRTEVIQQVTNSSAARINGVRVQDHTCRTRSGRGMQRILRWVYSRLAQQGGCLPRAPTTALRRSPTSIASSRQPSSAAPPRLLAARHTPRPPSRPAHLRSTQRTSQSSCEAHGELSRTPPSRRAAFKGPTRSPPQLLPPSPSSACTPAICPPSLRMGQAAARAPGRAWTG